MPTPNIDLIALYKEYIKFLGEELERTAVYLHTHNMSCSQEVFEKGKQLREKIETAEKVLNINI